MIVRTLDEALTLAVHLADPKFVAAFANELLHQPVHDEVYPFTWHCGHCPYMNHGPICTKCGAGIEDAVLLFHGISRRNTR